MKKWIRWKGLITFVLVAVVIFLAWILLVDSIAKRTIESAGTKVVGARVDLAGADVSLIPLGLTLRGLAVTNPDAPMTNTIEIARLHMDLNPSYLIRRKVVVNELVSEGVRLNTPRKRSGAVPGLKKEVSEPEEAPDSKTGGGAKGAVEKMCGEFSMPSMSQPDINAILAKEPLDSLALASEVESGIKAAQDKWQNQLDQLPDEQKLKEYSKRLEKLKKGGGSLGSLLGSAKDVQKLRSDIQKDMDALKRAQTAFNDDYKGYETQVRDLANAPGRDIQRLVDKYGISTKGLANLSQLIFGEKLCGWMQTAWEWYGKIKPYLAKVRSGKDEQVEKTKPLRGKGLDIHFAETPPIPDFLIRLLKVDAQLEQGDFAGKVENLTSDQPIIGTPTTYAFSGKEMKQAGALNLTGTADLIKPEKPHHEMEMTVKRAALNYLALIGDDAFPLTLNQANGDLDLTLNLTGSDLDAQLQADFSAAKFGTDTGNVQTAIAKAIGSALGRIDRFSLFAGVQGTLDDYSLKISSDLDKVLQSAVGDLVRAEADKLKAALGEQINAKLQGPMAQAKSQLAGLDGIEEALGKRLNIGNDLLKNVKLSF